MGKAKGKMFQSGAQKQRGDCSEVSHLDVVVSPTVTVFQPWTLQVSAKFLLISCPCFAFVSSCPRGHFIFLCPPVWTRNWVNLWEREGKSGVKKKTKQGEMEKQNLYFPTWLSCYINSPFLRSSTHFHLSCFFFLNEHCTGLTSCLVWFHFLLFHFLLSCLDWIKGRLIVFDVRSRIFP